MALKYRCDRTGFPMVLIEPLGCYFHYIPVTKVQFETFLCHSDNPTFNGPWYDELLNLNPRVAVSSLNRKNLHKIWISGIRPSEAEAFCEWNSEGMRLPTREEWFKAYTFLKAQAAALPDWPTILQGSLERCRRLFELLPRSEAGNLAEQLYFRGGFFEWVELPDGRERWGGMGDVPPEIHGNIHDPDQGIHHAVRGPELNRRSYYAFRALLPA